MKFKPSIRMGKEDDLMWCGFSCHTGWFWCFRNCWSIEIFQLNHIQDLQRMVQKRENMLSNSRGERKATVTQITTRYKQAIKKSIIERTTVLHLEADGQQKSTLSSTPVSWEQEPEATVHSSSAKCHHRRLEQHCRVWWVSVSAQKLV